MPVDTSVTIYPQISADLLGWYDVNARVLPWRAPPGSAAPDPYRVWLSEIMLQQTTVAAVKPYFERFTDRWPTVAALAAADEGALMAAWAGLGYYARARNLIACARAVVADHGGAFPDSEAGLRMLPGVGAYTAAAIAAIAFHRRAVVVDANVERVVARLFAVETPLPAARPILRDHADSITPQARAGDFAQAMMDLGASICTVRAPACLACPIARDCRGLVLRFESQPANGCRFRLLATCLLLFELAQGVEDGTHRAAPDSSAGTSGSPPGQAGASASAWISDGVGAVSAGITDSVGGTVLSGVAATGSA